MLLDLGLPGEDGLAIAHQVLQALACGLLIGSARGDPVDRVVGLELGVDDYIIKPFDLRELVARMKAVARRLAPRTAEAATNPNIWRSPITRSSPRN